MLRKIIIAAAALCALASPAFAAHHHHHRHIASRHYWTGGDSSEDSIVTVETIAGPIRVASRLADRFRSLISDFAAAGYHPRHIGCFATGGHVRGSRHYVGAACDFDQRGWGRTVAFMYTARAHAIIVANGFRDGREFRDQGHVDDGAPLSRVAYHHSYRHHYASR
jgi:hypothetical protein